MDTRTLSPPTHITTCDSRDLLHDGRTPHLDEIDATPAKRNPFEDGLEPRPTVEADQ
jgi:hypothetical protein